MNTCISSYFAINLTCDCIFQLQTYKKIFWNCTSSTMSLQNLSNNAICFLKNLIWKSLKLKVNVVFPCKYLTFSTIWRDISGSIILRWYYWVTKISWYISRNISISKLRRNSITQLNVYEIPNNVLIHNFRCVHVWVNERFRKKHNS